MDETLNGHPSFLGHFPAWVSSESHDGQKIELNAHWTMQFLYNFFFEHPLIQDTRYKKIQEDTSGWPQKPLPLSLSVSIGLHGWLVDGHYIVWFKNSNFAWFYAFNFDLRSKI